MKIKPIPIGQPIDYDEMMEMETERIKLNIMGEDMELEFAHPSDEPLDVGVINRTARRIKRQKMEIKKQQDRARFMLMLMRAFISAGIDYEREK